jgi:hypothetical protein
MLIIYFVFVTWFLSIVKPLMMPMDTCCDPMLSQVSIRMQTIHFAFAFEFKLKCGKYIVLFEFISMCNWSESIPASLAWTYPVRGPRVAPLWLMYTLAYICMYKVILLNAYVYVCFFTMAPLFGPLVDYFLASSLLESNLGESQNDCIIFGHI